MLLLSPELLGPEARMLLAGDNTTQTVLSAPGRRCNGGAASSKCISVPATLSVTCCSGISLLLTQVRTHLEVLSVEGCVSARQRARGEKRG